MATLNGALAFPQTDDVAVLVTDMTARINRRTTVSGLINEYHRAA